MDALTEKLSKHVKKKKINISKMARATGLSYTVLYDSLMHSKRKRSLRADEMISVCEYLEIDPKKLE